MKHYKFYWNDSPDGEQDHWGKSLWYMELDDESWPMRQIQIFENGPTLKYDINNREDEFGMLGDQVFGPEELKDVCAESISLHEFNLKWEKS